VRLNCDGVSYFTVNATPAASTPAQLAIAWLLAQRPWIVPIPGTTKKHRFLENIDADAVTLSAGEAARIGAALARIDVQGERYPEALERRTGL
jgi:aryl-alcohol dehydrogenase-like predicted oxidoreductase